MERHFQRYTHARSRFFTDWITRSNACRHGDGWGLELKGEVIPGDPEILHFVGTGVGPFFPVKAK